MIGQMAITIALPGFNNLGRSVIPTFLSRNRFYLQLSSHCPKMKEKSMSEVKKKIKISVHGTSKSYHLAAARRVKLWSLNANLLFKELHQLSKFT